MNINTINKIGLNLLCIKDDLMQLLERLKKDDSRDIYQVKICGLITDVTCSISDIKRLKIKIED